MPIKRIERTRAAYRCDLCGFSLLNGEHWLTELRDKDDKPCSFVDASRFVLCCRPIITVHERHKLDVVST
jgi:hypothetical protein